MNFEIGTRFTDDDYADAYKYVCEHEGLTIAVADDTGEGRIFEIVQVVTSELDMALQRIRELKGKLDGTDYMGMKYMEGALSSEEWEPIRQQRAEWRAEINSIEAQYNL